MRIRNYLLIFLLIGCGAPPWAVVPDVPLSDLVPSRANRQSTLLITSVIQQYHYRSVPLDDALSAQIMTRYLDTLDPNRSFFTGEDIKEFEVYNNKLDNALKRAWLDPAFNIFRVYRKHVDAQIKLALSLLDEDFDFTRDEEYRFDRSDAPWAKDQAALDEQWRKRVKNDVLGLRLADKDEEGIRQTLRDRYEGIVRRSHQLAADDVYNIFINAYTLSLEPHTSYMSPSLSENFDISMRLSLEGIGAVLSVKNEFTVVQKTVPGGPAALSGQVHAGDRISGVGQDEDGEMVDVVGWRLQDVVELIRGPKDSIVRLQVLPKDVGVGGPPKEVTIIRDKIKLEEQAAKKAIIEGIEGIGKGRIGVITVPAFYRDFQAYARGDKNFRSTTRDVRKLLVELAKESVDGVVIDLRQNGGGSLIEATELTGLFIETGPVVQVQDTLGKLEIVADLDPDVAYSGPLAVLVNRNSASASEIFAGAMQDYHRSIIIGEPTFGKGTVQTLIDLNNLVAVGTEQLGRLRLTMAQFFRVSGGSTQFRGVVPDIVYPTANTAKEHGERSLDNALPWAKIKAVKYQASNMLDMARLRERHLSRIESDVGFNLLMEQNKILQDVRDENTVSLMETKREGEWEERNKRLLDSRNRYRIAKGLEPLEDIKKTADSEGAHGSKTSDDEKDDGVKEIMVNEAALILMDQINIQRPSSAELHAGKQEVVIDVLLDCELEGAGC
ncbi:Tail-specific protease precursor [hydrothermal vent metagenome]|uniref:Tail-specific protease n=1 Tax=hydrothermal vent metagenome TaxID=652676 RepID=A0A3B1BTT9_9ZZZZ